MLTSTTLPLKRQIRAEQRPIRRSCKTILAKLREEVMVPGTLGYDRDAVAVPQAADNEYENGNFFQATILNAALSSVCIWHAFVDDLGWFLKRRLIQPCMKRFSWDMMGTHRKESLSALAITGAHEILSGKIPHIRIVLPKQVAALERRSDFMKSATAIMTTVSSAYR